MKVGDYYYHGLGVPDEPADIRFEKAAGFYQSAADTSMSALALWNLGYMYENGVGVPQDYHLAKRHYDSALTVNSEAYIPVTLSLMKLQAKSLWYALTGGADNLNLWHYDEEAGELNILAYLATVAGSYVRQIIFIIHLHLHRRSMVHTKSKVSRKLGMKRSNIPTMAVLGIPDALGKSSIGSCQAEMGIKTTTPYRSVPTDTAWDLCSSNHSGQGTAVVKRTNVTVTMALKTTSMQPPGGIEKTTRQTSSQRRCCWWS